MVHNCVDLTLSQKVMKGVVVCLILLHKEIIFHDGIKPHSMVKCGISWKLTDLYSSHKIGDALVMWRNIIGQLSSKSSRYFTHS